MQTCANCRGSGGLTWDETGADLRHWGGGGEGRDRRSRGLVHPRTRVGGGARWLAVHAVDEPDSGRGRRERSDRSPPGVPVPAFAGPGREARGNRLAQGRKKGRGRKKDEGRKGGEGRKKFGGLGSCG